MTHFVRRAHFSVPFFLSIFVSFCIFACAFLVFGAAASVAHAQMVAQNSTVITLTVLNPVSTTTYSVDVVKSGSGTGTVVSSAGGIVCGSICFQSNIPNASSTILTATADPGSTFIGWNVSTDPLACPGTGTCTVATTTIVTATFNLNNVPPPPPSPGPTTSPISSPSGPAQFFFEDFSASENTSSAVISWYTSVPSVSTVSWGLNSDGASGSGSETVYSAAHSIELDNLAANTAYVLNITAVAQDGRTIYYSYPFRTLPISNAIPLNVTNFTGQESFGGNILLNWNNPAEPDFSHVLITRGTRFYPRDPNEGYIVYQGSEEEALDTSAVPGQEYYYTAFAFTTSNKHSSGTILGYGLPKGAANPAGSNGGSTGSGSSTAAATAPTSTPIFGGTGNNGGSGAAGSGNGSTVMSSSSVNVSQSILSKINFIQNNKLIPEINSTVSLDASLPILIIIPANIVPANTEETTVTIGRGTPSQQSFMFEKLAGGSLQALIPAILPTGSTPFSVHFLKLGSEVRVDGTFEAAGMPTSFNPQSLAGYLFQTFISNNFLCTTVPVILMFFEVIAGLTISLFAAAEVLRRRG